VAKEAAERQCEVTAVAEGVVPGAGPSGSKGCRRSAVAGSS
jgi:hypothetical protein